MPKGEFRDALCLHFGWQISNLPQSCVCGRSFSVQHAFSCSCGGFPSICHNELHNLTADLLSEVCSDVGIEPPLQPLDNEPLHYATANREDGAHLDVVARDFWGQNRQCAFFDIGVFNPFASCYSQSPLSQCYITNELEKRRAYDERVREVERACFSPLVFSASGGMGPSVTMVYKKLVSMLAEKWNTNYSRRVFWLRCRVCFSLLRSAIMCVRGNRSAIYRPAVANVDLAFFEGKMKDEDLQV